MLSSSLRRFWWKHVRRYAYEVCKACGRPVARSTGDTYWTTTDALWNRVERGPNGIRCVPCFVADCARQGVDVCVEVVPC